MAVFLLIYGVVAIVGICVLLICAAKAPHGAQDSRGFRYTKEGESMENGISHSSIASNFRSNSAPSAAMRNQNAISGANRVYTRNR